MKHSVWKSRVVVRKVAVLAAVTGLLASFGASSAGAVEAEHEITTIAGTHSAGIGGDVAPGGPLTSLYRPNAIAVHTDGTIYFADTGNHRVRKIDPDGTQTTFAGTRFVGTDSTRGIGGQATDFRLLAPLGLAVDKNGVVYISDGGFNKIFAVATDGTISLLAGDGHRRNLGGEGVPAESESIHTPQGIAVDNDLNVYIADYHNNRVRMVPTIGPDAGLVFTFAGQADGTWGSSGVGGAPATTFELHGPGSIAVDKNNDVYITDNRNHRVIKVETGADDGVGGTFNAATVIAGTGIEGEGVTDSPQQATTIALRFPNGVAVDKGQHVYIAESLNGAVHKLTPGGMITRLSGAAVDDRGASGRAIDATLKAPRSLAVDKHGSLFIVDHDGHRVMKVTQPDTQVPIVSVTGPVVAASTDADDVEAFVVDLDVLVTIRFDCSDFYTGIRSCEAVLDGHTVIDGATVNTSVAGNQVLTITATDNATAPNITVLTLTIKVNEAAVPTPEPEPIPDPEPDGEPDTEPGVDSRVVTGEYANAGGYEGAVARLYVAVLDRQPEAEGILYWTSQLEAGRVTLEDIADYFISQEEFQGLYGATTVEQFVDLLYENVMQRDSAADPEGKLHWEGVLNDRSWTRSDVTMYFSQSEEFKGHSGTF